MNSYTLTIPVKTNVRASNALIAKTIEKLINSGLEDAAATCASGEGDLDSAQLATSLHIGAPTITSDNEGETSCLS